MYVRSTGRYYYYYVRASVKTFMCMGAYCLMLCNIIITKKYGLTISHNITYVDYAYTQFGQHACAEPKVDTDSLYSRVRMQIYIRILASLVEIKHSLTKMTVV